MAASRASAHRAVAAWRASPAYRAMAAAFADCPAEAEAVATAAEALLADGAWAAALIAPLLAALADDPLFEPPFQVSRDRLRVGARLFDCPAATLVATVTDHAALATLPPPATLVFSGRLAVSRTIRAGGATVRRWSAEAIGPAFGAATAAPCAPLPPLALGDGAVRRIDGRREAERIEGASRDVVTLVATIRVGADPLVREYDAASGRLLRCASADDRPSRTEMLLAFVRASGRADAGACFEAASRAPAFHLRWSAMREWLALDAAAALPRLCEMARCDPHPEVRAAAAQSWERAARAVAAAECRG